MFNTIEIFGLAEARARHAAARQATVATNIANADTPGYRAQDITAFEEAFRRRPDTPASLAAREMRLSTRDAGGAASPNGNTVSLELEMLRAVEAQRGHSRALTVYQSALTILRSALGR